MHIIYIDRGTSTEFPPNEEPYMGFVFELCDQGSLFNMLHVPTKPRLSPKHKINIAAQLAYGLTYLHTKRKVCIYVHIVGIFYKYLHTQTHTHIGRQKSHIHRDNSARNMLHTHTHIHTHAQDDKRAIVHRDISARNILLTGNINRYYG